MARHRFAPAIAPVETSALKLEADLQAEWSGGILERRVTEAER